MLNSKEIIFFVLVFIAIIVSDMISGRVMEKTPKNIKVLVPLGVALLLTLVLAILYILGKVSKDGFSFELTSAKKCDGGPYMTQSGPNHEFCTKLLSTQEGRDKYDMFNCATGEFHGRPLNFGPLTPLSNSNWENTSCDKPQTSNNWSPIPL